MSGQRANGDVAVVGHHGGKVKRSTSQQINKQNSEKRARLIEVTAVPSLRRRICRLQTCLAVVGRVWPTFDL
jgi:hypothetical protein